MRIAIIGNASTGKTTLVGALSRRLGVPLVPEFARDIANEWRARGLIKEVSALPPDGFAEFQEEILRRKELMEEALPAFVADRSTGDTLVIWLLRLAGRASNERYRLFARRCCDGMRRYDHVYLLPSDAIPFEADEFRHAGEAKRFLFDIALVGLMEAWGCPYKRVSAVGLDERVAEICQGLNAGLR